VSKTDASADETEGYCPVAATMSLLTGKWTLHILHELSNGKRRFNELSRALGPVSSRTVCQRLRALEDEGILVREIKNTIPPWVEYDLTDKGRDLTQALRCIAEWGYRYRPVAARSNGTSPHPNGRHALNAVESEICCVE
jgi:DNA-binding HxlR family transcriptional regulator